MPFAPRLRSPSSPFCCSAWLTMPTRLSKARSHSPDSSGQTLCIDGRSQNFSNHHNHHLNYNKTYSISGRPPPERPNVAAQIALVPPWRRRHESTNRAGHQWTCPGHLDEESTVFPFEIAGTSQDKPGDDNVEICALVKI